MESGQTQNLAFPETRWALVGRVRAAHTEVDRALALSELCKIYWPPIYAFIRSSGYSPHDSEDLSQGFFERFLGRNDFAARDASLGRLRNYLITSVKHFLANEQRKSFRQKRGGAETFISIDRNYAEMTFECATELATKLSPDRVFERQWAVTLLECVVQALAVQYEQNGKAKLFHRLKDFIVPQSENPSSETIAAELGMTEQAVRVAIHRLRKRYRECLFATVAETLGPEESAEDELKELMAAFA